MRALYAALAASFLLLQASTAAAQAERLHVEGYVYNKFTRVPVGGATVMLTVFGPITGHSGPDTVVVASTFSDGNGFYILSSDSPQLQDGNGASLHASCNTPNGVKTSQQWGRTLKPGPDIVERDLFIDDLTRQLAVTRCYLGPIHP